MLAEQPKAKRINSRFVKNRFYKATARLNKKYLTVRLPISVASRIKVNEASDVNFIITGNVLQLTGKNPETYVPLPDLDGFKPY